MIAFPHRRLVRRFIVLSALVLAGGVGRGWAKDSGAAETTPTTAKDPWTDSDLIAPAALRDLLAGPAADRPVVLCVGMASLYHTSHIPGAIYAGPGSSEAGRAVLAKAVHDLPHDRSIVIYCGCCPWEHCPNIRPAFSALRASGYGHVRVLTLPTNFRHDWVDAGLPVEKSTPSR